MEKRYEEAVKRELLQAITLATGKRFSEEEQKRIARGADELDLVNSGLEETMIAALHGLLETRRLHPTMKNLRTAAFLNAINKVARSYIELGIFP